MKNKKIKSSIRKLSVKALTYFSSLVAPNQEAIEYHITINANKSTLINWSEFKEAVILLNNDKVISSHFGKLVGTQLSMTRIDNTEELIYSFLVQLFIANREFNSIEFNKYFKNFEDFFYQDKLKFKFSVRIQNFKSNISNAKLKNGVEISRSPNLEKTKTSARFPIQSDHIMSCILELEKIVGDRNLRSSKNSVSIAIEKFENTMVALRILKPGSAFKTHQIKSESLSFKLFGGDTFYGSNYEMSFYGTPTELEKSELPMLNKILAKIIEVPKDKNSKKVLNRLIVASNRLSFGMLRQKYEDRIIDFMIGLEAIYLLRDERAELSMRLGLRAGFVMSNNKKTAQEIYAFLNAQYKVRSKVVHGEVSTINHSEINQLEHFLRQSIIKWIQNPNVFSEDELRTKIFFK